MIDVNSYLSIPYKDGARSGDELDCWGLALRVRRDMGLPELPEVGAFDRMTPMGMKDGYRQVTSSLTESAPAPGSLAAVFKGRAFAHVGVVISVDGRIAVIETNPKTGVRWQWLERFKAENFKVIFYSDTNLSEQTEPGSLRNSQD
jgi:hypothetical protein